LAARCFARTPDALLALPPDVPGQFQFEFSSNSSSARQASAPATMRPVEFEVSIPSRSERNTISRSRSSRIVLAADACPLDLAMGCNPASGIATRAQ
jgi:hypothetical protein